MTRRHPVGGLAALVATVALGVATGPVGAAAGLATLGLWWLVTAPYAVAAGQVLAVAVLPVDVGLPVLAAIEASLLAILLGPLLTTDAPVGSATAFVVCAAGLAVIPMTLLSTGRPLWTAAAALAVVAAVAAYALHRYERVRLGLVEEVG